MRIAKESERREVVKVTENQKQLAIERHSEQAEEFAKRYRALSADAYQNCFTYSRRRLDIALDRLLPEQAEGLRLLDIGCGTGYHMARYRKRGFEVSGVDGSEEMLKRAREFNPGIEFQHADVDALPYETGSFDFVMCIEVLRYLPDPAASIREMARVLKPGGVALVTANPALSLNAYWFVNRISNLVQVSNLGRLKQFFTTSGKLRRQFTDVGFDKTDVHGVYFGPLNWAERLVPSVVPRLLKTWEPLDAAVADNPILREGSNMFLVQAVRGGAA